MMLLNSVEFGSSVKRVDGTKTIDLTRERRQPPLSRKRQWEALDRLIGGVLSFIFSRIVSIAKHVITKANTSRTAGK